MKKFMLGLIVGLALPTFKRSYDFSKYAEQNPEDPYVIERREEIDQLKAEIRKLFREIKAGWVQAKTNVEFKDIIRDIDKN